MYFDYTFNVISLILQFPYRVFPPASIGIYVKQAPYHINWFSPTEWLMNIGQNSRMWWTLTI